MSALVRIERERIGRKLTSTYKPKVIETIESELAYDRMIELASKEANDTDTCSHISIISDKCIALCGKGGTLARYEIRE